MDRACKNCRFCIYAHSHGKDEPYCERHSKWIRNTLLCSAWEMVSVQKPQTNADRIRAMTDEELARFVTREDLCELTCNSSIPCDGRCEAKMLDWLKREAKE